MEPIDLHYVARGEGKPLVLLHGNGEDGAYFASQMDALSVRHAAPIRTTVERAHTTP